MKLLLKIIGSTLLIALCAAVLVFSGSFLWSAIPRQREEPVALSTEAFLEEESEAAPPAELIAPSEETAEEAPPETPEEEAPVEEEAPPVEEEPVEEEAPAEEEASPKKSDLAQEDNQ